MKITHFELILISAFLHVNADAGATVLSATDGSLPERIGETTRARAMGFAFSSLGDDASTLFINPAGLVNAKGITLYGEYTDGPNAYSGGAARGCLSVPFDRLAAAAGFFSDNLEGVGAWNVFVAGAAWRITEGAQGSFISIGADAMIGRLAREEAGDCVVCGASGTSDTEFTAGLGIMIRPLPVVSIGCSSANLLENGFETGTVGVRWKRQTRVAVSWFLQDRVVVSWERKYCGTRESDRYGICMRTSVPIELMSGFYDEKVTGGIRWVQRRFDVSIAFSPDGEGAITTSVCAQLFFHKKPDEIHQ